MLPSDEYTYGASELEVWFPGEYDAGYRARFAGTSESWTATACWRAGWHEADRERTASGCCIRQCHAGSGTSVVSAEVSLAYAGDLARNCDLSFDPTRSDLWKRSWIQRDIELGAVARKRGHR